MWLKRGDSRNEVRETGKYYNRTITFYMATTGVGGALRILNTRTDFMDDSQMKDTEFWSTSDDKLPILC